MKSAEQISSNEHGRENGRKLLVDQIKERHPDWPELRVTFYFAPHANHHDVADAEAHMKDSDILLYESAAGSSGEARHRKQKIAFLNSLSINPPMSLDEALLEYDAPGTTDEHRVRGVYDSGIAVGTIDIGDTEIEQRMVLRMSNVGYEIRRRSESYEAALENYKRKMQLYGELQAERERMMLDNFEDSLESILASRPDLKEKESLEILITMGSAHTTLRHKFTEAGIDSDRYFSMGGVQIYDYDNELIRTYMRRLEPTDELVQRAFTDNIIEDIYYSNPGTSATTPTDEWTIYKRRLVSKLNGEQMEHIFSLWNGGDRRAAQNIQMYLDRQGIGRMPESAFGVIAANMEESRKYYRKIGKAAARK